MVNFPAYLTRLELVPLCLQTQHSVRESSGFFFFSGGSMLLRPGRLPLFAAGAELSSNFGFCENQPRILISKRSQIHVQVFWGTCLRSTRSCIKHCISKWTEVYRGRYLSTRAGKMKRILSSDWLSEPWMPQPEVSEIPWHFPDNCKFPWPNELTNSEISLWWTQPPHPPPLTTILSTTDLCIQQVTWSVHELIK